MEKTCLGNGTGSAHKVVALVQNVLELSDAYYNATAELLQSHQLPRKNIEFHAPLAPSSSKTIKFHE